MMRRPTECASSPATAARNGVATEGDTAHESTAQAAPMTTCRETIELLLDYLDGDLPAELRANLEEHLGGCQPCGEFLETYRATMGLCKKALAAKMPEEAVAKLHSFLKTNIEKKA
jgi:hypothetical protein